MNWDRVRRERGLDREPLTADEPQWMISEESRRRAGSASKPTRKSSGRLAKKSNVRRKSLTNEQRPGTKTGAKRRLNSVTEVPKSAFAPAEPTRAAWAQLLQRIADLPEERRFSAIEWFSAKRHVLTIGGGRISMTCDVDNPALGNRQPRRVEGLAGVLKEMAGDANWTQGFILLGPRGFTKQELRQLGGVSARQSLTR